MYGLLTDEDFDVAKLQSSIMAHEGLRLKPYRDTVGKETIGYGRNITDRGITAAEASYLLSNDIEIAIAEAKAESWWPHVSGNDARSRGCIEMLFNMGLGSFRGFHDAIACLRADDFSGAADAFLASKWAGQVGKRAAILTEMIRTGQDAT